jgi:hypothetical protein
MTQPKPVKTPIPTAAEWEAFFAYRYRLKAKAFFAYQDRLNEKLNFKANSEKPRSHLLGSAGDLYQFHQSKP